MLQSSTICLPVSFPLPASLPLATVVKFKSTCCVFLVWLLPAWCFFVCQRNFCLCPVYIIFPASQLYVFLRLFLSDCLPAAVYLPVSFPSCPGCLHALYSTSCLSVYMTISVFQYFFRMMLQTVFKYLLTYLNVQLETGFFLYIPRKYRRRGFLHRPTYLQGSRTGAPVWQLSSSQLCNHLKK